MHPNLLHNLPHTANWGPKIGLDFTGQYTQLIVRLVLYIFLASKYYGFCWSGMNPDKVILLE